MFKKSLLVGVSLVVAGIISFYLAKNEIMAAEKDNHIVLQKGKNKLTIKKTQESNGTVVIEEVAYMGDPQKKSTGSTDNLEMLFRMLRPAAVDYKVLRIFNDSIIETAESAEASDKECVWFFLGKQWWRVCQ